MISILYYYLKNGGFIMATCKMNIFSCMLGRQTSFCVILPEAGMMEAVTGQAKDYYKPGMKYQVLWLLHGFGGDEEDYIKWTNVVRYAQDNKLMVVMPSAYNGAYVDKEYGEKYTRFVAEELPKIIYSTFPASSKREDNFIAGLSMGGAGAMLLGLAYPEKYSYVYCMSGACTPMEQPGQAITWFGDYGYNGMLGRNDLKNKDTIYDGYSMISKNKDKDMPSFTITCGSADVMALDNCKVAYEELKKNGYHVNFDEIPNYNHEWDFWDLQIKKAILEVLPLKRKPIYK